MSSRALIERWIALAGENGRAAGEDLIARYSEPHRRYHGVRHLIDVLNAVDELAADAQDADAVRLAAWFHDAVYAAGTEAADVPSDEKADEPSDEEASARLAEHVLGGLGLPAALVAETARLVRLTETHAAPPDDANAAVLCDADLAILGSGPEQYAVYTRAVREEYRSVPEELFRPARARILRALLSAPSLYRTPVARARYEQQARANVTAEIGRLDGDAGTEPE
ncbi:MAG TPA: metal-dependent phosphohydrolase [Actinospica sp.]|nr:metal-dependent phosphohydrolase [Actinospica sp.]